MQLTCPHCSRLIEYSGEAPRFCAYCGQSISTQGPDAPTLGYEPVPPTLTTGGDSGDGGGPAPAKVGGYKLVRTLGGGGMGTVYEAEDAATGRRVALKLIAPQFATSREAVERFRQEGRLASAIAHPRCVFVVAADEEAGRPYIAMELMPGDTLEDLVRREGPLPPRKAIAKVLDVIEGLNEAHRLGVIHRDVKPSNCFLDHEGRVKVGDFGLSKSLASDQHLTKTGSFLGTVLYSSPEQVRRETLDPQTDVYSVAATLYFLLTGRAPFQTGDAMATVAQILSDPPTPPRQLRPDIPPALERVLLKGLERDRERRYRDLGELRAALIPFFQRQFSIGSVGWRLLAYVFDAVLITVVQKALGLVLLTALGHDLVDMIFNQEAALELSNSPLVKVLPGISLALWFAYFFGMEGLFGATLGKLFLRLRVLAAEADASAGWARLALRTLLCLALTHLGDVVTWFITATSLVQFQHAHGGDLEAASSDAVKAMLLLLLQFLLWGGGLAFLVSTMRTRNGHRGLHEMLSGTRVIRLPERRRQKLVRPWESQLMAPSVHRPSALPDQLGPLVIRGALRWDDDAKVLLGEDESLRRKVWIWLRPSGQPGASATRHNLNRTTRLRWLMAGTHEGQCWDAFVAPNGGRLVDLVAAAGPLSWPETRPLLEQLGSELALAIEEWTLPDTLDLDQVWLQTGDRAILLDLPLRPPAAPPPPTDVELVPSQQDRCLALLRQTALVALEGRPRGPEEADPHVEAPIPGYATELLGRLSNADERFQGPKEFREELAALRDEPDDVTRRKRFGHLAILTAFSSLWLFCCIPFHGAYMSPSFIPLFGTEGMKLGVRITKEEFQDGMTNELAVTLVNPNPWTQLGGVALYDRDLRLAQKLDGLMAPLEEEKAAITEKVSPVQRWMLHKFEQMLTVQDRSTRQSFLSARQSRGPWTFRTDAERIAIRPPKVLEPLDMTFVTVQIILLSALPVLFILWAFIARGGFSFRLAGIALVRANGRPAWRLQCLWRAFLVWAPIAGLLALSMYCEGLYWSGWSDLGWRASMDWLRILSYVLWYVGLALIPLFAALALILPRRSVHDWLAGTYLVPR